MTVLGLLDRDTHAESLIDTIRSCPHSLKYILVVGRMMRLGGCDSLREMFGAQLEYAISCPTC